MGRLVGWGREPTCCEGERGEGGEEEERWREDCKGKGAHFEGRALREGWACRLKTTSELCWHLEYLVVWCGIRLG